jgi:uncharacterized protein (TIGR02270 family)
MASALMSVGVPPAEISTLINRPVIEEHASEAAFLWRLRERAIHAPHYRLTELAMLDARVLAHLEGLRVAGVAGLEEARRALSDINPGTLFVAAFLAFTAEDSDGMRNAISISLTEPQLSAALVAALAWQTFEPLRRPLSILGHSSNPVHRRICLAVYAAHRVDAGSLVTRSVEDPDPALRARALRAIGEIGGRDDLRHVLRRSLTDDDLSCRFWAAWSLSLTNDSRGAAVAFEATTRDARVSRRSIEVAMRAGDLEWARTVIRALAADPAQARYAVLAAGALGDPVVAPWLLDLTAHPKLGRVAAESFALITGVELDRSDLKQDAPEDADEGDPDDSSLRWPNPAGLKRWWKSEQTRFASGQRYLVGLPVNEENAARILQTGYQRQRRAAAIEISRLRHGAAFFPIAARADWQRQRLAP